MQSEIPSFFLLNFDLASALKERQISSEFMEAPSGKGINLLTLYDAYKALLQQP